MNENKYDVGARLYGATSYSNYAHLLTATKTVITVQDFDSPQLLQFRRTTVIGPDLTTPNLLQFRRTAIIGPVASSTIVKQVRYMLVAIPPTDNISMKALASTALSTV